jgi:hypothetical protein
MRNAAADMTQRIIIPDREGSEIINKEQSIGGKGMHREMASTHSQCSVLSVLSFPPSLPPVLPFFAFSPQHVHV